MIWDSVTGPGRDGSGVSAKEARGLGEMGNDDGPGGPRAGRAGVRLGCPRRVRTGGGRCRGRAGRDRGRVGRPSRGDGAWRRGSRQPARRSQGPRWPAIREKGCRVAGSAAAAGPRIGRGSPTTRRCARRPGPGRRLGLESSSRAASRPGPWPCERSKTSRIGSGASPGGWGRRGKRHPASAGSPRSPAGRSGLAEVCAGSCACSPTVPWNRSIGIVPPGHDQTSGKRAEAGLLMAGRPPFRFCRLKRGCLLEEARGWLEVVEESRRS